MALVADNVEDRVDGRRNPDGNQNYDIVQLWSHHNEIIRYIVAGVSSNVRIAQLVGCTPQTVSNVRNNPLAQARIAELSAQRDAEAIDIGKKIQQIAPLAVDVVRKTLLEALDDEGDTPMSANRARVGATTALGLLDHAVPKRVQGTILHGHMTLERINEIKQGKFRPAVSVEHVEQNEDGGGTAV
jgi:hypothetical protein